METNWILIVVMVAGGLGLALRIWHSRRQARQRRRLQTLQRLQELCKPNRMRQTHGGAGVEQGEPFAA
jgi:hypothetical protein